jgi:transposase
MRPDQEELMKLGALALGAAAAGASEARHMLCEAAWIVVRYPSPLRAFGERIRARRGAGIATVAVARKLVVLFWHLLTTEKDYAFGRPSLTKRKLRRLQLLAGAKPRRAGGRPKSGTPSLQAQQDAEIELARQAEIAYRRLAADWQQSVRGADATRGHASQGRQGGKQRARHQSQPLRFSSSSPAPTRNSRKERSNSPAET